MNEIPMRLRARMPTPGTSEYLDNAFYTSVRICSATRDFVIQFAAVPCPRVGQDVLQGAGIRFSELRSWICQARKATGYTGMYGQKQDLIRTFLRTKARVTTVVCERRSSNHVGRANHYNSSIVSALCKATGEAGHFQLLSKLRDGTARPPLQAGL